MCVVRIQSLLVYPMLSSIGWAGKNQTMAEDAYSRVVFYRCLNKYVYRYPKETKECGKN